MIVMSLDVSKDHVLRKIMTNLNWSGEDTNVFCLLYISWYFIFVNISKYRYCSKVKHTICILEKWRMLFIKDYNFTHIGNLRFFNFERRFFQQLNMKISQKLLFEEEYGDKSYLSTESPPSKDFKQLA